MKERKPEEPKDPPAEPEKFVLSYELSHGEIRYALYQLLSATMETDNEWYFIDQGLDDEYKNWEGTKIYRTNVMVRFLLATYEVPRTVDKRRKKRLEEMQ